MSRLLKTRLQSIVVLSFFMGLYLLIDRSDFFIKQFPQNFDPPKSAAQIVQGDLFGTCAPIEQLKELNGSISPVLSQLKETPFFRTYKINLERECPFWAQQRLCNNNKCAICECDENDVPDFWKLQQMEPQEQQQKVVSSKDKFSESFTGNIFGSFQGPNKMVKEEKKVIDCPQNDKEWCVDDQDGTYEKVNEADYILVNLIDNQETYTAYAGGPVWNTIYEENCMLDKAFTDLKFRVNEDKFRLLDHAESCTETTLLYHLMSGFHTSVNTHISEGFEGTEEGTYTNNQTYFLEKVGNHPERVKNLHFIYAAVVKAVIMMEQPLIQNDYETGLGTQDDLNAKRLIKSLLKRLSQSDCDEPFREKNFFQNESTDEAEMELLSEIQYKFYNISRVMDCISCDKCRLNGKMQVRGLATALKVLFLPDSKKTEILKQISNQEIVSVMQLLIKLSESLDILDKNREAEHEFGIQVWICQQIATFASATLITLTFMLMAGFSLKDDEESGEGDATSNNEKTSQDAKSSPKKVAQSKSNRQRDKID